MAATTRTGFRLLTNYYSMISRQWTGLARRHRALEYIEHLKNDTFKHIAQIDGFHSAQILKRDVEEGVEFLIVTSWKDIDAIKKFAGADFEQAVVPKLVQDIMIRYDARVRHFDVEFKTD